MTAIVLRQQDQAEIRSLAEGLAQSGFGAEAGIGNIAQAAVAIIAGREIGIGPVEAISAFHFTSKGVKPSAELLAKMVRRHPRYDYAVAELTDDVCELRFYDQRDGGKIAHVSRFTREDAKRAGLTKDNWQRYPRNMLFSRAMTNGVAWYAPDVIDAMHSSDALRSSEDGSAIAAEAYGEGAEVVEADPTGAVSAAPVTSDPEFAEAQASDAAAVGTVPTVAQATAAATSETPGNGSTESLGPPGETVEPPGYPSEIQTYRRALWEELRAICQQVGVGQVGALTRATASQESYTLADIGDERVPTDVIESAIELVKDDLP